VGVEQKAQVWNKTSVGVPYWIKVVVVFFLGWFFIYADRVIMNPVLGQIQSEFALNMSQVGFLTSVFFFAYALAQIPSGVLGDKYGRKLVLVLGFVFFGVCTGLTGMVTGYGMFLLLQFLTGIGQGTYYGPQYGLSSEAIPLKFRSLGSALINSGGAAGIGLGYIASSYISLVWDLSWRTLFLLFSVPTVLVGLVIWWTVRDGNGLAQNAQERGEARASVPLHSLFRDRTMLMIFAVLFCSLYGFFMILTWLPYYLQNERGMQGSEVGYVSSLVAWASIPGALLFSKMSDKLGRRKPLAAIMLPCAAASICAIVFIHDYTMLIVALVLYGLTGKMALDPVLIAFVADNVPKEAYSKAFSVYNFIGMCSSIVAPYVTGFLAEQTGSMASGFYLAAGLLVLALVLISFAREKPIVQS
jgi:MFS family permease